MNCNCKLFALFFLFPLQLCISIDNLSIAQSSIIKSKPCEYIYINKNTHELFQDMQKLILNCDSTFSYKHISCMNRDTCYGRWNSVNNIFHLTISKKLKSIISKQPPFTIDEIFIDLGNTTLIKQYDFIIWKRSTTWTDTLYKQ